MIAKNLFSFAYFQMKRKSLRNFTKFYEIFMNFFMKKKYFFSQNTRGVICGRARTFCTALIGRAI